MSMFDRDNDAQADNFARLQNAMKKDIKERFKARVVREALFELQLMPADLLAHTANDESLEKLYRLLQP